MSKHHTDRRIESLRRDGLRIWKIARLTGLPANRVIESLQRLGEHERNLMREWRMFRGKDQS